MTTKRTFEMVAGQIEDGFVFLKQGTNPMQSLRSVAWNIANGFEMDNPRFNKVKFLNACGIEVCSKCGHTIPMENEPYFGKHECQW